VQSVIKAIEEKLKKPHVVDVRSGDTVRVHQKIREGNKERIQVFEGMVIRVDRKNSHTSSITVRRIASGVGVEKTYLLHSPLVVKVEVTKRSKVRRNYLSYMRARTGKSARLTGVAFDRDQVNAVPETPDPAEEQKAEAASNEVSKDKQAEVKTNDST
jgi:large subunit ribosomal protein L19